MKKMLILITALVLTGCSQQVFKVNDGLVDKPTLETQQAFFVNGIGQTQTIDAANVCGGAEKVNRTEVQQTGLNIFLGIVTLGIYTPREARVYCNK